MQYESAEKYIQHNIIWGILHTDESSQNWFGLVINCESIFEVRNIWVHNF